MSTEIPPPSPTVQAIALCLILDFVDYHYIAFILMHAYFSGHTPQHPAPNWRGRESLTSFRALQLIGAMRLSLSQQHMLQNYDMLQHLR
jgi:hypothetical protein